MLEQPLIADRESTNQTLKINNNGQLITFQQCLKLSQGQGLYNRKLFILIAAYWLFASFFLALPFFLFKKPIYCQYFQDQVCIACAQGNQQCANNICSRYSLQIIKHIQAQQSLTYSFHLFCSRDWIRVLYKISPETLSILGFLIYGAVADRKGRKVALKISWRMYTVGIVMFSMAQTPFLKMFGYILSCVHCFPSLVFQLVLFFEHNIGKYKNRQSLLILPFLSAGPLILSLASQLILETDNRKLLGILCAGPAFILSMLDGWMYESAVCMYKFDKALAFGIANQIAKSNKIPPIMIDLSKSFWHKYVYQSVNIIKLLRRRPTNAKMLVGFFFLFLTTFNVKVSQISLDQYTDTEYRSIIVNIPTALADISLCLFLLKFKYRTCRIMNIMIVLLLISLLACGESNFSESTMKTITIIHAVLIRYLSELCDGLLLIWAIETFPTISRAFCVGFVYCGVGFGVLTAYLLRQQIQIAYILGLACTTSAIVLQGFLQLNKFGVMTDTLSGGYYDQNDSFYKC